MKIVMGTHYFASHKGGIEIVADRLFRGLAAKGCEIVWIAGNSSAPPDPVGSSHAVGLRVFNFVEDRTGLPAPLPTLSALRNIRSEVNRADALVLHDCLYLTNVAAFLLAKFRKTPLIIVQHVGIIPYGNPILKHLMKLANLIVTRPMLSHAEQVVFISEETKRHFESLRFKTSPILIFNGVDTDLFHPVVAEEAKSVLRGRFDLPSDCPAILFVGRFIENKGITILKQMASKRPNWTWVFAGRPGPVDPRDWGAANVRVLSELPDASLAALYRACDLFVLPSRYEAFSLVVREALATGLPAVCTTDVLKSDPAIGPYVQSIPVYADDNDRTATEFLLAIDEVLNTKPNNNSEQRRAFAVSRYSWQSAIERYSQIISDLTA